MMKLKTFSVITIVAVLSLLVSIGATMASPTQPTFGTFVNAGGVPIGSKLVLNITHKVTNDEDSGFCGYWALSNYNKHVEAWVAPDGTIYFVASYTGSWETFEGVPSPQDCTPQGDDGSGTFEGGYTATCTGNFTPGDNKTKGNIGSFVYGGTMEDVLLGTYGSGQTGITSPFNFLSTYFDAGCNSSFTLLHWGWTYNYKNQTWNNFDYGSSGDIVIP